MKLVFPNGEHAQAMLGTGINRIGSAPDCDVVLRTPAMPGLALEIHVTSANTHLVPQSRDAVQVNGKPVGELMALRAGDRIGVAGVEMRLAALAPAGASVPAARGDDMATRMIAAVPRYVLRGLNGACFNKQYPLAKPIVIGRAPECDIVLDLPQISRRHAQLRPTAAGVVVEDLGSSNGLWINDRQVAQGTLRPGDELRLDQTRFTLSVPAPAAPAPQHAPAQAVRDARPWGRIAVVIAVASVLAAAAFLIGASR